jgi:dihydroxyacetone kinase
VDALVPFVDTLRQRADAGASGADAWTLAAREATRAAEGTAALRPRTGRARPLADRSVGTPDPGATSLALALDRVAHALTGNTRPRPVRSPP